jgi:hypothetical protein
MVAPGSKAPVASVTTPVSAVVLVCANRPGAVRMPRKSKVRRQRLKVRRVERLAIELLGAEDGKTGVGRREAKSLKRG